MRLTDEQIQAIRDSVSDIAGSCVKMRACGSRLQDDARGRDLDLLVELPEAVEHPARLSAHLSARISRAMHGRSVDIVLLAPNLLRLPTHDIALREASQRTVRPNARCD